MECNALEKLHFFKKVMIFMDQLGKYYSRYFIIMNREKHHYG